MNQRLAGEMLILSGQHLLLVLIAIGVASVIAVPTAIALTRLAVLRRWLLGLARAHPQQRVGDVLFLQPEQDRADIGAAGDAVYRDI